METLPVAAALNGLYRSIQPDLERVEEELKRVVPSANPLLREIGDYLFQLGGKRVRPALLLLSNRLFAPLHPDAVFWSAMVEILHTASLIHDDIVDNSDRRRGKATVHARWGANITVLLGDYLYIQSILLSLRKRSYALIDILADVTARMIEGELIETSWGGKPEIPELVYRDILDRKTAALFAGSSRIGAELGGATPEQAAGMEAFGRELGMCFQLVDDWLDYAGDASALGKPVLSDLREGRFTLPLIRCLGRLSDWDKRALLALVDNLGSDPSASAAILERVRATGALDETLEEARRSADRAETALRAMPEGEDRTTLLGLIGLLLKRDA
jgi:octaprenyl-diphosphate synthase